MPLFKINNSGNTVTVAVEEDEGEGPLRHRLCSRFFQSTLSVKPLVFLNPYYYIHHPLNHIQLSPLFISQIHRSLSKLIN